MELNLSNEDAAFRDEVGSFIAESYPAEMRVANPETDLTKEQSLLWHRILYNKGWIAPAWPKEYGGPGWTITQRYIFEQETSWAGTLPPLPSRRSPNDASPTSRSLRHRRWHSVEASSATTLANRR